VTVTGAAIMHDGPDADDKLSAQGLHVIRDGKGRQVPLPARA
jgi:hypothetical protein